MTQTPPENTPSQSSIPTDANKGQHYDALLVQLKRGGVLIGVLTVILLLLILVPRTPGQISIIGDMFTICLVICPLLLCLAPIYILLAIAAFYTNKLNNYTGSKLGVLSNATQKARSTTERVSEQVGQRSIGWRARFAIFEQIIDGDTDSQEPESPTTNDNANGDQS